MGTTNHLEATVFLIRFGEGHHDTNQLIGEQELVFIPIPIILVPFPGATNFWLLLHQLTVKVTNRTVAVKQFSRGRYHSMTSDEHAVYILTWIEPERKLGFLSGLIIQIDGITPHDGIFHSDAIKL